MILTGVDEPSRRDLVPSRIRLPARGFRRLLPITPPEGSFGPGPRSRPEAQAFINEWPCAVLPDEIEAGNIRALINVGGSLVTIVPETAQV